MPLFCWFPRQRRSVRRPARLRLEALEERIQPTVESLSGHLVLDQYDDGAGMGSVFLSDTDLAVSPSGRFVTATVRTSIKASTVRSLNISAFTPFVELQRLTAEGHSVIDIPAPSPSVAMAGNGDYAVAYVADNPLAVTPTSAYIDWRSFETAGGSNLGIPVPDLTDDPDLALRGIHGFVVVGRANDRDGSSGVYAQLLTTHGDLIGGAFSVPSDTDGAQTDPVVAADGSGNFVVAWVAGDGSGTGVFARRFAADGTSLGDAFRVNEATLGDQAQPSISVAPDGSFLVGWTLGSAQGVFARRFEADDDPVGGDVPLSAGLSGQHQHTSVAYSSAGTYVAAWEASGAGARLDGIVARSFEVGHGLRPAFRVNLPRAGFSDTNPRVAFRDAEQFLITFNRSQTTGGELRQVIARRFFAGASPDDIAGLGQGNWWAGQSNGSQLANRLLGPWSTAVSWQHLGSGDFDGDGLDDVAGRDPSNGLWWVGRNTGSGLANVPFGTWANDRTYANVFFVDFNGDGRTDVVGRDPFGNWWAGISDGTKFVTRRVAVWSPAIDWRHVFVGDVSGNGGYDIVGYQPDNGIWWASVHPPPNLVGSSTLINTVWGMWNPTYNWQDVRAGDFDGDLHLDIVGRAAATGELWVGLGIGANNHFVNQMWGHWSPAVAWGDIYVADVNGDGFDDLVGRDQGSGNWWVGKSSGTALVNRLFGNFSPALSYADILHLDFDRDGNEDVIGRDRATGAWWLGRSTGDAFVNSLIGGWSPDVVWAAVTAGKFRP